MPRFLVLYRSSIPAGEAMANASPEQAKAGLEAWMAWAARHDGSIVVRADDGVHLSAPVGGDGGYSAGGWRFSTLLILASAARIELRPGHHEAVLNRHFLWLDRSI